MDFIITIISYWDSTLAILLVFGGLIFVHELGHYLANRAMKIGVITFSLGMGPKLWSFKRGRTEYRLSWLPFGGYVAAVGTYCDEIKELGFTENEAIYSRPPWQRLVLAFSGPFANLLLAWLIYVGLTLSTGLAIPLPQIGEIMPNSPAITAGLQKGDMIVKIDETPVTKWEQIPLIIRTSNGKNLRFEVERDNNIMVMNLTPKQITQTSALGKEETIWLLGMQALGTVRHEKLGIDQALIQGTQQTWNTIDLIFAGLKKLLTGSVAAEAMGGPLLIAEMIANQASVGIVPLLLLTALISINLGLLNLLPIPVLDGGTILFSLLEMLIRRPLPYIIQEKSVQVGAVLLISFMVFATYNDIMHWIS